MYGTVVSMQFVYATISLSVATRLGAKSLHSEIIVQPDLEKLGITSLQQELTNKLNNEVFCWIIFMEWFTLIVIVEFR